MMATPDASQYNPAPAYIRALLERAGISQTDAAARLGITHRTMRRYVADRHCGSYSPAPYTVQFALECLADLVDCSSLRDEIRCYLVAAADGSMSRNNSEQLASELLERLPPDP